MKKLKFISPSEVIYHAPGKFCSGHEQKGLLTNFKEMLDYKSFSYWEFMIKPEPKNVF